MAGPAPERSSSLLPPEQDQQREPPPESAIAGEGGGAEDIAGLNSMIPAMIWAVPPKAMASGITTGSPAAGNRPALMLLKRTVVSPKPIKTERRGVCGVCHECLPAICCCGRKSKRLSISSTPGCRADGRSVPPVPAPGSRSTRRRPGRRVWRISSSISTGAGPSASSTAARMRSASASSTSAGQARMIGLRVRESRGPAWAHRTDKMSSALSVRVAPSRISRLAPLARGIQRRARHGENLAALFQRILRGDQRAGSFRRLHHHHAARQAGDDAVAAREMARLGRFAERASPTRSTPCVPDRAHRAFRSPADR